MNKWSINLLFTQDFMQSCLADLCVQSKFCLQNIIQFLNVFKKQCSLLIMSLYKYLFKKLEIYANTYKCNLTLKEFERSFKITPMFLLDLCTDTN
jgi:hypothetical protein